MKRAFKRVRPGLRAGLILAAIAFLGSIYSGLAMAQSNQVPAEDTRNTEIIGINTHMPLPSFSSVAAWEARKASLRRQILVSAGLSPMPEKTPLHPQVFGKIEGRGYTIEKVLIETLPGFYLGGNLYRPRDGRTKHPGILNPHGHWQYGRLENELIDSGPALGISLARQGYVVFAYDMVGYTDTIQIPHRFGSARQRLWSFGPLGLQLWDSIRAMDFITSLDDVDANNIGMTGASGGGTQTFLLAAIDERVKFASPVNMVSAIMQGGDLCENAPGLRLQTSNVEFAAMFAPRPMLLVSDTTDWTRNVPHEEYPAIKSIYELYGKGDKVSVVQFEAEHNFNQQSREAVYKFFAQVNQGLSDSRELSEHDIEVPKLEEMMALAGRTLPANAVDLNGLFHEWRAMAEAQNAQVRETQALRTRMLQTLAIELPDNVISQVEGQEIMLSLPGFRGRLKGISIKGTGDLAIVIDAEGAAAAMQTDTAKRLKKERRAMLAFDLFQTGDAKALRDRDEKDAVVPADGADATDIERKANHATGGPAFLTFNVTDDEARVQDIVSVIAYAEHLGRDVEIYAQGDAAIWATFAAAVSRSHVTLHLENLPNLVSDDDYLMHFNVPGILRAGGLPAAERLANSR